MSAADAEKLRAALGSIGYTPPAKDRTVTSEADAFASKLHSLPAMAPPTGPYEGARVQPKYATIPTHVIPAVQPLPPPMDPSGPGVAAPDPVALQRQRAMLSQQQAAGLHAQRPGFAQIPQTVMPQGGPLPPPMPPPGAAPAVMTPQEVAAFKARVGAGGEHCECREKG